MFSRTATVLALLTITTLTTLSGADASARGFSKASIQRRAVAPAVSHQNAAVAAERFGLTAYAPSAFATAGANSSTTASRFWSAVSSVAPAGAASIGAAVLSLLDSTREYAAGASFTVTPTSDGAGASLVWQFRY